jgi:pimeloyl-ACP methyl ester carboxylesterase
MEFVESIEDWRRTVGLNKMILLGHSLGGYLAASYALRHSEHVKHLILIDPWGFQERPADMDKRPMPLWIKCVRRMMTPMNPFSALRIAGPWGPSLITKFKSDLIQNYSDLFSDNRIADYMYHCNAQTPSGEIAFKTLTQPFGWAKNPMLRRVTDIPSSVSMTFVHGAQSWIDSGIGKEVKYQRSESAVDFKIVRGAGHHIYADAPDEFNRLVADACNKFDHLHDGHFHEHHASRLLTSASCPDSIEDRMLSETNDEEHDEAICV